MGDAANWLDERNPSIEAVPDSDNAGTVTVSKEVRAACGPYLAEVPDEGAHLLVRHAGRVPVEPPSKIQEVRRRCSCIW